MSSSARLRTCALLIFLSGVYAVIVAQDRSLASAVAVGYIALVLTVMLLTTLWKKGP